MSSALDEILAPAEQARVTAAIRDAESRTSGQIKVHVEPSCRGDAMARARSLFASLALTRTTHRNAVLLYVAPRDRKFAVLGDRGIHAAAGDPLWERAAAAMKQALGRGSLGDGLVAAIAEVGQSLARSYPRGPGDTNELADDISTGAPRPDDEGRGRGGAP